MLVCRFVGRKMKSEKLLRSSSPSHPINTARVRSLRADANAPKCSNVQGGGARCAKSYRSALARLVQDGVVPVTTNVILSEVHRTWSRPEAGGIGKLFAHVSPNYAAVVERYVRLKTSRSGPGDLTTTLNIHTVESSRIHGFP